LRLLIALALLPFGLVAQKLPDLYKDETHGDPPFLSQPGWRALFNGLDLTGWRSVDGSSHEWFTSKSVVWKRVFNPVHLVAKAAPGDRIVNGRDGKTANLVSTEKFGSFELYVEFMLARGSNSGVYLHGLYEVQIFDSQGYSGPLTVGDCGGVYQQDDSSGGSPPSVNACRAPGEWQSLHIWFQAPRFDAAGKKIANARVLRVMLNDTHVQENVEVPGPTVSHMEIAEAPVNPLMLQGDHGPVAFRNLYVRELGK
jgi:hypothetical protein